MLDPELLALLVCPETHQDIALATSGEIILLNESIRSGKVRTAGGMDVKQPVEGALIRADRAIAYPIRDGIPVMLVPEGLVLQPLKSVTKAKAKTKPKAGTKLKTKAKPKTKPKTKPKASTRG